MSLKSGVYDGQNPLQKTYGTFQHQQRGTDTTSRFFSNENMALINQYFNQHYNVNFRLEDIRMRAQVIWDKYPHYTFPDFSSDEHYKLLQEKLIKSIVSSLNVISQQETQKFNPLINPSNLEKRPISDKSKRNYEPVLTSHKTVGKPFLAKSYNA
jgi:hypothetical protein